MSPFQYQYQSSYLLSKLHNSWEDSIKLSAWLSDIYVISKSSGFSFRLINLTSKKYKLESDTSFYQLEISRSMTASRVVPNQYSLCHFGGMWRSWVNFVPNGNRSRDLRIRNVRFNTDLSKQRTRIYHYWIISTYNYEKM